MTTPDTPTPSHIVDANKMVPTIQPLAAGKRRIKYNLKNGCGDECSVTLEIPNYVTPRQRAGVAIFKARRTMPDQKPWRCTGHEEIDA